MSPDTLDRVAVTELTRALLRDIRDHYLRRPTARATAKEALNALAICLAHIFKAAEEAGDPSGARDFFEHALAQQLDAFEPEEPTE